MYFGANIVQSVLLSTFAGTNLTKLFGPGLSNKAEIILPEDSAWNTEVQQRWTNYQSPTYLGAIKPVTEHDIEHIVYTAQSNDIPFLATGGGHGITDFSGFNGIAIDLGNFDKVYLDTERDLLTIGGAVKYSQLHQLLYDAGKELPMASCPCVGVVGATMGGGIGPLIGHRGLMLDALESVRIIVANGTLVTASKHENEDLFWGVRGAGANFGIVTEATYKVYEITNQGRVTVIDLAYLAAANRSFWETLHTFDNDLPSLLAYSGGAMYNRDFQQPVVGLHAVYFGPEDEARAYLEPFISLQPIVTNITTIPQSVLFPGGFGACLPDQRINLYTTALKGIDPETLENVFGRISELWSKWPDYDGRLVIQRFATEHGVSAVPEGETAYAWRDARVYMNIENFYVDPSHDKEINEFALWARRQLVRTSGFDELATYVNYAHGDEGPEAWYSASKLPKLAALKRKWDPEGLFGWYNPVPHSWDSSEL